MDREQNRTARRDAKRHKRRHGMRSSGRSVLVLAEITVKKAKSVTAKKESTE